MHKEAYRSAIEPNAGKKDWTSTKNLFQWKGLSSEGPCVGGARATRRASCCAGILDPHANLCALEVVGSNPASATKTPGQTQESLAARINDKYHHAEMIGMVVHLGSDLERYL